MSGVVYICHHVDTEGPLLEDISELFDRLKLIFGIDLKPTKENLVKLQNNQIKLPRDVEAQIQKVIDPHVLNFKSNWKDIENMLENVMSEDYRNKMLDSNSNGWVYNWNIMDHVGYIDNPRHRDMGYLNIFNFYERMIDGTNSIKDGVHWHFHPISFYKKANIPATSYDNSMHELHQSILRRLVEKSWFPRVNRAGFHSERIDSNLFLEQWIPFDPSNQAVNNHSQPKNQKDMENARYGDWNGAPTDWSVYSPSIYDWRMRGACNRVIARILNMNSRHRNITIAEIESAFKKAKSGDNVYLGITNHDWREMSYEIDNFRQKLKIVADKFPCVKYEFSESILAFQHVLGYKKEEVLTNNIKFECDIENNLLKVKVTNGELFGPQPYLALKTITGDYFHDNFDFHDFKKSFTYTFDKYTLTLNMLSNIVIASNDKYGNTYIVRFDLKNGEVLYKEMKEVLC
jgi:hypothetical protein